MAARRRASPDAAVLPVGSLFADLLLYDQETSRADGVKFYNRRHFHVRFLAREFAALHVNFLELDLAESQLAFSPATQFTAATAGNLSSRIRRTISSTPQPNSSAITAHAMG